MLLSFPEKSFFNKSASFIERRRISIENYLNRLVEVDYIQERLYLLKPIGLDRTIQLSKLVLPKSGSGFHATKILSSVVKIPKMLTDSSDSFINSPQKKLAESLFLSTTLPQVKKRSSVYNIEKSNGEYILDTKFAESPYHNAFFHIATSSNHSIDTKFLIKLQYLNKTDMKDIESLKKEYELLLTVR